MPWTLLLKVLAFVALLAGVYVLGGDRVESQWRHDIEMRSAAEAARAASAAVIYGRHAAAVAQAAEAVAADNEALKGRSEQLQEELIHARTSLLARPTSWPTARPVPALARDRADLADPGARLVRPISSRTDPTPDHAADHRPDAVGLGADPDLSQRAVRLWNDALSPAAGLARAAPDTRRADALAWGAQAADEVLPGASGPDPSATSGSGITLSEAWSNHIENATSCAQDRARLGALQGWLRTINPTQH